MKKTVFCLNFVLILGSLALCSCGEQTIKNKDKGLIFYNRQPSNPVTLELDTQTMAWNDKTFYVGFDAAGGGAVQGKLITDTLAKMTMAEINAYNPKCNDGKLHYVLCIGDDGHNDSKARTKGVREALGTWNGSYSGGQGCTVTGSVKIKGDDGVEGSKTIEVIEERADVMKSGTSTWDATTAKNTVATWKNNCNFQMIISNNDGMAMGALQAYSGSEQKPLIFGYDANKDALAAIKKGELTGTVTQNADAQAAGTLQSLRNILDGYTGSDIYTKGFTIVDEDDVVISNEKDKYGNLITPSMVYRNDQKQKAILAKNAAVNKDNIDTYYDPNKDIRDAGIKQTNAPEKKILLTVYSSTDDFLSQTFIPAVEYYAKLMNLKITYIKGDGKDETKCIEGFVNLGNYDAYAINMVSTNSGFLYLDKLKY